MVFLFHPESTNYTKNGNARDEVRLERERESATQHACSGLAGRCWLHGLFVSGYVHGVYATMENSSLDG